MHLQICQTVIPAPGAHHHILMLKTTFSVLEKHSLYFLDRDAIDLGLPLVLNGWLSFGGTLTGGSVTPSILEDVKFG